MVVHAFNPHISQADSGRSLSLRPTEKVAVQTSLGSERNHGKRKAGEDVIEQVGHFPATANSRTYQI